MSGTRRNRGLDREAVIEAFSEFLSEERCNLNQIRFVRLIIDFIVVNGNMEDRRVLQDEPFRSVGSIITLFKDDMDTATKILSIVEEIKENSVIMAYSSSAIRIPLRFMLMCAVALLRFEQCHSHSAALHAHVCCRTIKLHANVSDCEQAPISQFGAVLHCSFIQSNQFSLHVLLRKVSGQLLRGLLHCLHEGFP